MIVEQGRVVAVEADGVWVETANQSACSRCSARAGCGQSLLAQLDGHRSYIKASLQQFAPADFAQGDAVTIGVHGSAVVRGSLLVYLLPLVGLIAGAAAGESAQLADAGVAMGAAAGMLVGGLAVRWFSRRHASDARYQPVVLALAPSAQPVAVGDPQSLAI